MAGPRDTAPHDRGETPTRDPSAGVRRWWIKSIVGIPSGLIIVLFIVRTALEDRLLHDELDGYREFAQVTRFRLIPGIW